jgi:hypothetical protein
MRAPMRKILLRRLVYYGALLVTRLLSIPPPQLQLVRGQEDELNHRALAEGIERSLFERLFGLALRSHTVPSPARRSERPTCNRNPESQSNNEHCTYCKFSELDSEIPIAPRLYFARPNLNFNHPISSIASPRASLIFSPAAFSFKAPRFGGPEGPKKPASSLAGKMKRAKKLAGRVEERKALQRGCVGLEQSCSLTGTKIPGCLRVFS